MFFSPVAGLEVELAVVTGRPEEAVRLLDQALAEVVGREYEFSVARLFARGIRGHADIAERVRARGDDAAAAASARAAKATLDRFEALLDPGRYPEGEAVPMALAYAGIARGELSRAEDRPDPQAWADAAARMDDLGMVMEAAYARWRQAEALVALGGDRAEAKELVSRAAGAAAASGATGLLDPIAAFARRVRLPIPGAADGAGRVDAGIAGSGLEELGLTARELEVLALVADGRTNREIGESLYMAEKTASVHVSRILAKLGVRSRVEAATAAHRLGIAAAQPETSQSR
jgi:DNA-binding CsgD family transcriptional regulator